MDLPTSWARLTIEKAAMRRSWQSQRSTDYLPTSEAQGLCSFLPCPPSSHEHTLPTFPHDPLADFDTVMAAIIAVLAASPQGTLESPALDGPSHAVAALCTAFVEPGLACLQKP